MINYGNISKISMKLLKYTVLHIYKWYINIQDIENTTITFNAITRYLSSSTNYDSILG